MASHVATSCDIQFIHSHEFQIMKPFFVHDLQVGWAVHSLPSCGLHYCFTHVLQVSVYELLHWCALHNQLEHCVLAAEVHPGEMGKGGIMGLQMDNLWFSSGISCVPISVISIHVLEVC